MTTLAELATVARPLNDDDWSSERQVDAENRFFDAFHAVMGDTQDFDIWCLNATSEEALDEGMRLVEEKFGTRDVEAPAPTPSPSTPSV